MFEDGATRGVPAQYVPRLRRMLLALHASRDPSGMGLPGYKLHPLKGDRQGQWAVWVSGNWRLVFRFEDGHAVDVDLVDYH